MKTDRAQQKLTAMASETLRQRQKIGRVEKVGDGEEKPVEGHPGGDVKQWGPIELLRLFLFIIYSWGVCIAYVSPSPSCSEHPLTF